MKSLDFGIVSTVTISKLDSGHLLVFKKPKSPKIGGYRFFSVQRPKIGAFKNQI